MNKTASFLACGLNLGIGFAAFGFYCVSPPHSLRFTLLTLGVFGLLMSVGVLMKYMNLPSPRPENKPDSDELSGRNIVSSIKSIFKEFFNSRIGAAGFNIGLGFMFFGVGLVQPDIGFGRFSTMMWGFIILVMGFGLLMLPAPSSGTHGDQTHPNGEANQS